MARHRTQGVVDSGRRLAVIAAAALVQSAAGQATVTSQPTDAGTPEHLAHNVVIPNPDDPIQKAYAQAQKKRSQVEKEMYKLRATHFRNMKNVQVRQVGIAKLREYTDPALYPSLVKIFRDEGDDVRAGLMDHFADQQSDEGDTTLAWLAVTDREEAFRNLAAEKLAARVRDTGEPSLRVQRVIAAGLKSKLNEEAGAAAHVAEVLGLYEAIPMMVASQVSPTGGGGDEGGLGGGGDLAWIMVGQQQAYVSDLEPVVADNAVGFDPQLAVVTSGVVLRVSGAVVTTYRMEVHNALVAMSSEGWGKPTGFLGWDNASWMEWWDKEFKPVLAAKRAKEAEERAAKAAAVEAGRAPAPAADDPKTGPG